MQILFKSMYILKLLIFGFYNEGIKVLVKSLLNSWFSVCIVLSLLIYLCSNPKTYFVAWLLIGIFAIYSVIKAICEIFLLIIKYKKTVQNEDKEHIITLIGGKIFDIAISAIGVFQAGKILRHSVKIVHAANSTFSLVDDVTAVISKLTKDFFK